LTSLQCSHSCNICQKIKHRVFDFLLNTVNIVLMGYRTMKFSPGSIYHIFNRGVEKRRIFQDNHDRRRFISLLPYCLSPAEIRSYSIMKRSKARTHNDHAEKLVDILCYCLMPNHFHLLLKENSIRGVSTYMQRLQNSYSRYFNTRYDRVGPLFSGRFQAVPISDDEQCIHVARYIHLNPFVARLIDDPLGPAWSSLAEYLDGKAGFCQIELLSEQMSMKEHRDFLLDHASYARELELMQHLTIDEE